MQAKDSHFAYTISIVRNRLSLPNLSSSKSQPPRGIIQSLLETRFQLYYQFLLCNKRVFFFFLYSQNMLKDFAVSRLCGV